MGNHVWAVFAFFASAPLAFAAWGFCWYQALRRLSPEGEAKGRGDLTWFSHVYTSREDFTAAGWRYRWGAIACPTLPVIAAATCAAVLSQ